MPRRRRTPKGRIGSADRLTHDQRNWFFNGFAQINAMDADGPCLYAQRVVFDTASEARTAWRAHREELLEEFSATRPGQLPWPARLWGGA